MTIIWSLSIVFFVSCESAGDKRLDFALEQAGKNRIELEKVLNYYRNDSFKLVFRSVEQPKITRNIQA